MPFYEYECSNCKFYSEVMQKISDAPLAKCPSCGKKTMVKLVSAPNFRLKGGGWYETDFKGDKENKRNLAGADREESSAKSETPSTPSTKADSTAKTEATQSEGAKSVTASSDSTAKPAAPSGGSSGGESKETSPRRGSGASSKPVSRAPAGKAKVAASKAKPALTRSKAKPAAKKKARR